MHHDLESLVGEQLGHGSAVGQVELAEAEGRLRLQPGQAVLFQPDAVIVVEVVKPHHLVAGGQQPLAQMEADEAGSAGNENLAHGMQRESSAFWPRRSAAC